MTESGGATGIASPAPPLRDPYLRQARITRVVDGDPCDVDLSLGFSMTATHRLRLLGVNTPELHATDMAVRARAEAAKAFTTAWVEEHRHDYEGPWPYIVRTEKSDVFGRFLAQVFC